MRTALFEFGHWYGVGLTPRQDALGQLQIFRWLCLGFFKVEVWRGTLIERLQQRLPMVALRDQNENLRDELAERDDLIRRQADRIAQLELELHPQQEADNG